MSTIAERQELAMAKLEAGTDTFHQFLHGPDTDLVATESGNIPTLSNLVKQQEDDHAAITKLVVDTTNTLNDLPSSI